MTTTIPERRIFDNVKYDLAYYERLCDTVGANRPPYNNYMMLLQTLYKRDYIWFVPMDANRHSDGFHLRLDFADDNGYVIPVTGDDKIYSCTVLEVLLALSIRIDSEITGEPGLVYPEKWFWTMINNLGLAVYDDDNFDKTAVDNILDKWLTRKFAKSGVGSPFPLRHPFDDQRKVELWQQMQNYITENEVC